ncbi:putative renalase isoform X2 [Penaeus vannamei]|uniref:Putative renalase isoform X2 n=1 Tax=Penaeus vannamei TaxID=6689 RepID=A0A423SB07_PENVA|nr:putative renalase isoform X2 [Penaeus vannamei]
MATSRSPHDKECTADLGAQYISATPEYAKLHTTYYEELINAGVLAPLTTKVVGMKVTDEGTKHYVTPSGVSSIVKHFMKEADIDAKFGHHVSSIETNDGKWNVKTQQGEADNFDAVVLTMPVPQLFGLTGSVKELLEKDEKLRSNLQAVDYSSRYALGLFYEKGTSISLKDSEASAQYVTNDPIIRFVAIDNQKRGAEDNAPSVVIHTSVPFGKAHVEKTPEQVQPMLVKRVKEMFPEWPEPNFIKCQKWRFSQVSSAYPGLPGCVTLSDGLVVGGDGFTHSNMDGCIESAKAIAAAVVHHDFEYDTFLLLENDSARNINTEVDGRPVINTPKEYLMAASDGTSSHSCSHKRRCNSPRHDSYHSHSLSSLFITSLAKRFLGKRHSRTMGQLSTRRAHGLTVTHRHRHITHPNQLLTHGCSRLGLTSLTSHSLHSRQTSLTVTVRVRGGVRQCVRSGSHLTGTIPCLLSKRGNVIVNEEMSHVQDEVGKLQQHLSLLREQYVKLQERYTALEQQHAIVTAGTQVSEGEDSFVTRLLRFVADLYDKEKDINGQPCIIRTKHSVLAAVTTYGTSGYPDETQWTMK